MPFETRTRVALIRVTDAQPAERFDPVGDVEEVGELASIEQRDPTDAEAGSSRGEPQVLNRARARPHVGVGERRTAEHPDGFRTAVAAHDDPHRCFTDPFELQVEKAARGILIHRFGLRQALSIGHPRCPRAGVGIANDDESPGLAVTDRWRAVGGLEEASDEVVVDVVGAEAANISACSDDRVQRIAFGLTERPSGWVACAVRCARRVADQRDRPLPHRHESTSFG